MGQFTKNKFPRKQEPCPLEVNRSALHVWGKTQRYGIDKFCSGFIAITKREKSKICLSLELEHDFYPLRYSSMLALKWLDAIRRKNLLATSSKIIQEKIFMLVGMKALKD